MSGIAGIFHAHSRNPVASTRVDAMLAALVHREPEDHDGYRETHAALGTRRSRSVGSQREATSMRSADGAIVVVCEGDCDNYDELRRDLESTGTSFRSRHATELIVHGFRKWGARQLAVRMRGAYGFCIWERDSRRAWLVRDRLGAKPVYYIDRNDRFAFASQLRSIVRSGLVRAKIDETALWDYLGNGYGSTDQSLISGVRRLRPGHLLEWHDGRVRVESYWTIPNSLIEDLTPLPDRVAAFQEILGESLGDEIGGDGSLGCHLSGDTGSSLVAGMIAKRFAGRLRTFSVTVDESSDPRRAQHLERVAAHFGAEHREIVLSGEGFARELPGAIRAMDEPAANPRILSTHALTTSVTGVVETIVTGEGATELFAAGPGRPSIGAIAPDSNDPRARALEWSRSSRSLSNRVGRIVRAPRTDERSAISGMPYALDVGFVWSLLHPDRRPTESMIHSRRIEVERRAMQEIGGTGPAHHASAFDSRRFALNGLLPELDGLMVAGGLRARTPYLDHRVVEFAFRLPGPSRSILQDTASELIPDWIGLGAPDGFDLPLDQWFRGPLEEFVREALFDSVLGTSGLLDPTSIEALFVAHTEMDMDLARPLWQLVCLSRWYAELVQEMAAVEPMLESSTDPLLLSDDMSEVSTDAPIETGRCDIIVPIYGGVTFVRDLLRSIERHTRYPYRVILVDDSDDDSTHTELQALAATAKNTELYRNDENLGFVGTSNRGFSLGRSEFVCLLNSDTIVTSGWLERMIECAEHDPRVAIVNPLSNKSSNLSVPIPPGLNANTMAERVAELSQYRYPDITTAVGFCMLIKRRYLDWLGGFDPIYGHGYCEESDLCMRFTEAGLRVVIAEDAFVYHKGCGSFGTWTERYLANRKIFDARWSEAYARDYENFAKQNPIQYVRDALLRHTSSIGEWNEGVDQGIQSMGALPRTTLNPEFRAVRFPNRSYVETLDRMRLPVLEDGVKPLRITFLVASMPISGGITAVVQLAREMILAGHDVRLVTETHELEPERFNLPVQPLVFASREDLIESFPESDIVVATYWTTAADYLEPLRERYDFVAAYYLQDYEVYFYPEDDSENRSAVARSYACAEHRLVESEWVEDLVKKNDGFECDRVHLGLDLGIFWDRKGTEKVGEVPRIVSVARPNERRRGFLEVVDVFDRIHRERPDVEFVFFGTPQEEMPAHLPFPYRNEGRIQDLNRVAELISSADVLVDSSLFQGFGRPGLEAMACGTPCVLTSEGGIMEYARGDENCLVVPPRLTAQMSEAILRLLDDEPLRERLRRGGLETAARFSHVHAAEGHLRLYRKWCSEHREDSRKGASLADCRERASAP